MCKYGPRFFVGYTFLAWEDREMTGQTETHISQNYHTTPRSNKTGRDFFYPNPGTIASNPLILGIRHFDTEV